MQHYRSSDFGSLPPGVKNLLILNGIFFLAKIALGSRGINLDEWFGLFYPGSMHFKPFQILTHFFMHANFTHILFNMFGVWMFGRLLEMVWGSRRFIYFYMITAFAAAFLHFVVVAIQVHKLEATLTPQDIEQVYLYGRDVLLQYTNFSVTEMNELNYLYNIPVVGASGALFGLLGACFVLFPNTELILLFPPIPIKLKYFVTFYGLFELYMGLRDHPGDNVAHFAHLGGLIAGIIIVKYWNKSRRDRFF
ncbi:MAG: rhomboid family intramembrane serine protease [Flavobacteriales bacterium]|nr:rhomboid family intramembrane serine protease [Flavobacteriales bacterium]